MAITLGELFDVLPDDFDAREAALPRLPGWWLLRAMAETIPP